MRSCYVFIFLIWVLINPLDTQLIEICKSHHLNALLNFNPRPVRLLKHFCMEVLRAQQAVTWKKAQAQKCVSSFCLWFVKLLRCWAFRAALVSFQTLVRLIYITKRQENTGSQVQTLKGSNFHTFTPPETPFTWSLSRSKQEKVQTPPAKSCRSNWSLFFHSSHQNTFLAEQTGWAVEKKLRWHI